MEARNQRSRCQQSHVLTEALGKNFPLPLPSSWWLLSVLGVHWIVTEMLSSLPPSSHGVYPGSHCVPSLFLIMTPVIGLASPPPHQPLT